MGFSINMGTGGVGLDLAIQQYDDDAQAVGDPITTDIVEFGNGLYRYTGDFTITSGSVVVYDQDNPSRTAIADIEAIDKTEYSLTSEYDAAKTAASQASVDALRGATITFSGPVVDVDAIHLVAGDDYFAADNRALQWNIANGTDLTGATVRIEFVQFGGCDEWEAEGEVIAGTDQFTISFDLARTLTEKLARGDVAYHFTVKATLSSGHVDTLLAGEVEVT